MSGMYTPYTFLRNGAVFSLSLDAMELGCECRQLHLDVLQELHKWTQIWGTCAAESLLRQRSSLIKNRPYDEASSTFPKRSSQAWCLRGAIPQNVGLNRVGNCTSQSCDFHALV